MGDFVRVTAEAGIATMRLERPPVNALNGQMQKEIGAAAAQASADPEVRAVILYGGEKTFAAGADVKEMAGASHARIMDYGAAIENAFKAVARIPKPVIAAVTGYALGGGLELALCADFRVLAEKAKVGQPEILLGVIPGAGGTHDQDHRLSVEVALRVRRLRQEEHRRAISSRASITIRTARASSARASIRTRSRTATTRATCSTSTSRWSCRPTPRSAS